MTTYTSGCGCKVDGDKITKCIRHRDSIDRQFPRFAVPPEPDEPDYGGAFDGFAVSSDADSGL